MSKNYENGKIYIIYSPHSDNHYIGSCTTDLKTRLDSHIYYYKQFCNNSEHAHYVSAFEVLKFGDVEIELICDYPSKNRKELFKAEGYVIRDFRKNQGKNCVNQRVAGRTKNENYHENKERISAERKIKHKEQMENNEEYVKKKRAQSRLMYSKYKEKMNKKASQKITCQCGVIHRRGYKASHIKTKGHLAYINNLIIFFK
jgi:hypothetical protein